MKEYQSRAYMMFTSTLTVTRLCQRTEYLMKADLLVKGFHHSVVGDPAMYFGAMEFVRLPSDLLDL